MLISSQSVYCFKLTQLHTIAWTGALSIIFKTRDRVHPIRTSDSKLAEHPTTFGHILFCRNLLSVDKCNQQTTNPITYDKGQIQTSVVIISDAYEHYPWPRQSHDTKKSRDLTDNFKYVLFVQILTVASARWNLLWGLRSLILETTLTWATTRRVPDNLTYPKNTNI